MAKKRNKVQYFYSVSDLLTSSFSFFQTALKIKSDGIPNTWLDHTKGKKVVLFFEEASTRTRLSFELAAQHLGMSTISLSGADTSLAKGETLQESMRFISLMHPDVVIIRSKKDELPPPPKSSTSLWINAGSGQGAHPTQSLLDYVTLIEARGEIRSLKIGFCGDVARSRVFRSHLRLAALCEDVEISVCSPNTVTQLNDPPIPFRHFLSKTEMINHVDVLYVLRNQKERPKTSQFNGGDVESHSDFYRVTPQDLVSDVYVMHPGPIDFETDMDRALLDSPRTLIDKQVENGLYTRICLLGLMMVNK